MLHWPVDGFFPSNPVWAKYYSIILQWPLKLALLSIFIIILGRWGGSRTYQALIRKFPSKPYCWLLLAMLPLIAYASSRPDFIHSYPKLQSVYFIRPYSHSPWPWYVLFECCYGSDFLSIELFFRGLLVVGMAKYVGKDCILPMAVFYCCVHFGKPLAECISSFGGGLLLGIIAYRSRSIGGGLLVHLGIAFLMEAGGYLGHHLATS
jgi:membrane protease YdiL (CAAX protease family)